MSQSIFQNRFTPYGAERMSQVRNAATEGGPGTFVCDCGKSIFSLLHVFSNRVKAPPFCFLFFLTMWAVWWLDRFEYLDTSAWALPPRVDQIRGADQWANAFLHWFAPQGFFRTCWVGSALLILGYTYEELLGTTFFMMRFLVAHGALLVFISFFNLEPVAIRGIEPTLVCLACLCHFENPKVSPQAIRDDFLKIKSFVIEPRWHLWLVMITLLILHPSRRWNLILGQYALGLFLGTLYCVRYPVIWSSISDVCRRRWRFFFQLALYAVTVVFLPVTAHEMTVSFENVLGNSAFSLLNICLYVEPLPQVFLLLALSLAFLPLAVLLVDRQYFSWIPGVYAVVCIMLGMYVMNTQSWLYVNVGFVSLLYSIYGFLVS